VTPAVSPCRDAGCQVRVRRRQVQRGQDDRDVPELGACCSLVAYW
jgi:hypothetical protein